MKKLFYLIFLFPFFIYAVDHAENLGSCNFTFQNANWFCAYRSAIIHVPKKCDFYMRLVANRSSNSGDMYVRIANVGRLAYSGQLMKLEYAFRVDHNSNNPNKSNGITDVDYSRYFHTGITDVEFEVVGYDHLTCTGSLTWFIVPCPYSSQCRVTHCEKCNKDFCGVHDTHISVALKPLESCFNWHTLCTDAQEMANQFTTESLTGTCESCGQKYCKICGHSCSTDGLKCPNTPLCHSATCPVCSAVYCDKHSVHLCSGGYTGQTASGESYNVWVTGTGSELKVDVDVSGTGSSNSAVSDLRGELIPILGNMTARFERSSDLQTDLNGNLTTIAGKLDEIKGNQEVGNQKLDEIKGNQDVGNQKLDEIKGNQDVGNQKLDNIKGNQEITNQRLYEINVTGQTTNQKIDEFHQSYKDFVQQEKPDSSVDLQVSAGTPGQFDPVQTFVSEDLKSGPSTSSISSLKDRLTRKITIKSDFDVSSTPPVVHIPLDFPGGYDFSFNIDMGGGPYSTTVSTIKLIVRSVSILVWAFSLIFGIYRSLRQW